MEECQQTFFPNELVSSRRSQRRFGAAPGSHKWRYQKLSGGPIPSRRQTGSWERKWGMPAISREG